MRGQRPVLVFSSPKTGTSSLAALIAAESGLRSIHCHRIAKDDGREKISDDTPVRQDRISRTELRGLYARWRLSLGGSTMPWSIVCSVRDPVARCVSGLFQDNERFVLFEEESDGARSLLIKMLSNPDMADLTWFDRQLKAVTGIDVYEHEFDPELGYLTVEQGRFRVLFLRFEDMTSVWPTALQRFLHLDRPPTLPRRNAADTKSYSDRYMTAVKSMSLPKGLLASVYSAPVAQHFYAPAELGVFSRRWVG